MKKILTSLLLLTLLATPMLIIATTGPSGMQGLPTEGARVWHTINTFANWLFAILLIGAVIVILIAAFTFLTAAGDADKTAKARGYITYAVIAIVVAFLAKALVVLIASMVGVSVPIII